MSKAMIERDEVPDDYPFDHTHVCFMCGGEMVWESCEECDGRGWLNIPAADKDCPKCYQRGGEWVCHKCNIAQD
jgi:hypothetical protein